MNLQKISDSITVVPNFPKEGIYFRDVSPILANDELREFTFDMLAELVYKMKIDYVAGIESRGFIFATALAQRLKCGFIMLRKPNKMPNTIQVQYGLEYGKDVLSVQQNLIPPGKNILIVDDLLATGGSLLAGCELIEKIGCNIVGCLCLIELFGLPKNEKLNSYKIFSLIKCPANSEDKFVPKSDQLLLQKRVDYYPIDNLFLDSPSAEDDRVIVFSHPSMKSIADGIISSCDKFRSGTIKWEHFPDGYPNIRFEHLKHLENKRVVFIGSLYNQAHLLEQLSMVMVLPRQFIESLDIIFPYFAPGTMERVDEEGILATAETTAKILSSCLPVTKQGLPILHIFDLHALGVRFYFPDSVIIRMESAIPLLKQRISKHTTIAFPDEGASKRFKNMFSDYRTIVCSKVREGDSRNIKIIDKWNWPTDDSKCMDDVLIVDDLVQSGGTLEECRKALKGMGAKQISAYVTHPVFPNRNYRKFFNGKFHKFYTTNSIPEISNVLEGKAPFEIIKLDEFIRDTLLRSYKMKISTTPSEVAEFTIYVGSTNDQKLQAVYNSMAQMLKKTYSGNQKINVYGVNVSSDVSEQPVNGETLLGCKNRMQNLSKYIDHHCYKYDFLVSIENGASYEGELTEDAKVYDFCAVNVVYKIHDYDGKTEILNTECISDDKTYFPAKFLIESIKNDKSMTAGGIIEKEYGLKSGSWHKHFGEVSRYEMMYNSVTKCLTEFFTT